MSAPKLKKFDIGKKVAHKFCFSLYEAVDLRNGQPTLLKLLDNKFNDDQTAVLNFINGARIVKHLNHPNIVSIVDYGNDQGWFYIATEPNPEKPLTNLIEENFSLSFEEFCDIFTTIGKTLRYVHLHGLTHGFLNPNSIFIKADGGIKIDDFGFSWFVPEIFKSQNKEPLYFAQYIAPEYYDQVQQADGRGDIYSLGIILYYTLKGKTPYHGAALADVKKQHLHHKVPSLDLEEISYPSELELLVKKCLSKHPDHRFQNFKEFVNSFETLRRICLGQPKEQEPISENIQLSFQPEQSEKYFEEEPEEVEKSLLAIFSGFRFDAAFFRSKKIAFSGVAVLVLLALFFLVSNKSQAPSTNNHASNNTFKNFDAASVSEPQKNLPETNHTEVTEQMSSNNHSEMDNGLDLADQEKFDAVQTDIEPISESTDDQIETFDLLTKENDQFSNGTQDDVEPSLSFETDAVVQTAPVKFYVKSDDEPLQANIFLGDEFIGKTDRNGQLEITELKVNKSFIVRVSKEGYSTGTKAFTVTNSMPLILVDLKSDLDISGTVILDAIPKADFIYVDDILQRGQTPLTLALAGGEHTIRFVNSDLQTSSERTINLKVGQVLRIKHDFTKVEKGRVAVSLKNAAQYGFGYVYIDGKLWEKPPNTTPLQLELPVGSHTIEVQREGFVSIPRDVIVNVEKNTTKSVAFTLTKIE